MNKKPEKAAEKDPNWKTVCRNRKAHHEYEIIEELECGIALRGSEVKSIRNGKISIDEAYARVRDGELWLIGCDIAEYPQATVMNHEPRRPRKLLLHKRELRKFAESAGERGLTLIPLAVYFKRGIAKVKIAIARGRKLYDKREKLKQKADRGEMRSAVLKRQT
jgi:SsrA-binding protein